MGTEQLDNGDNIQNEYNLRFLRLQRKISKCYYIEINRQIIIHTTCQNFERYKLYYFLPCIHQKCLMQTTLLFSEKITK